MIANKKILWAIFGMMVIAQLAIPAQMIYSKNQIKVKGITYKFELDAIDPTDPYRGKYIILNPKERQVKIEEGIFYQYGEGYATLGIDSLGFAKIKKVYPAKPQGTDYIKVECYKTKDYYRVNFPFRRYYMNEYKARPAETLVRNTTRDTSKVCYAEVAIYGGGHTLLSVKINGQDIEEF